MTILDHCVVRDKLQACAKLSKHIEDSQIERDFYKDTTIAAKQELAKNPEIMTNAYYTFKFAQNLFLPSMARQEGLLYFKTPRKVQVFGVRCEGNPKQVNYLLDETDTIGMDGKKCQIPNTVVSPLYHYFSTYSLQERECFIHCDNCAGQNKNKTVVAYFAWRCLTGLHRKITLSFTMTGHTRCLVDGLFGIFKQKYQRADIYTIQQLADTVSASFHCNIPQLLPGSGVVMQQWDTFFLQLFKLVPGDSRYHHFEFSSDTPGVMKVKEAVNGTESEVNILRATVHQVTTAGTPPALSPPGLSPEKQAYLHKEIRPFVPAECQDVLCPAPAAGSTAGGGAAHGGGAAASAADVVS